MPKNDREILNFWSDFEFQHFEQWLSMVQRPTPSTSTTSTSMTAKITSTGISTATKTSTTTTSTTSTSTTTTFHKHNTPITKPLIPTTTKTTTQKTISTTEKNVVESNTNVVSGNSSHVSQLSTTTELKITSTIGSTTSLSSSKFEHYRSFCYEQKLAFCTNCQPMCTIHINCITHNICYDGTPFNQIYWTPLIDVCCGMCNTRCQTAESQPETNFVAENTESEIVGDKCVYNGVTGSPMTAPKTHHHESQIGGNEFVSDGNLNLSTENSLKYIIPIISVVLLGFIVLGFYYHIKLRNRKSKYSDVNRIVETISTISSEDDIAEITNVPLTELWERIKTDDNYRSINSGTFHQAPLASVLHSQTTRQ